jgi:transcriptional regulator with XRE-family HTH domain
MSTPGELVAANIRAEVARRALTQQQLADMLGVGQWWISRRLTGNVPISADDLVRIAAALGVPAATLLLDTTERVA